VTPTFTARSAAPRRPSPIDHDVILNRNTASRPGHEITECAVTGRRFISRDRMPVLTTSTGKRS
jgi:hypothetical protein